MQVLEKLGVFYLGNEYDLKAKKRLDQPVMYDARDLTTHGVCVGMTGSGKTGLCIDLLEEAALDQVPAIIIDPKGDITNLLLTFPELKPEDFEPWVNVDDARRKNLSVADYAHSISKTWRTGLADWGQGPDRIQRLKESAEFRIYTPGSEAGTPVSILASLNAPGLDWDQHHESLRDQIQGTVSALLGLAGISADPLRSREHILLSTIFEQAWRNGEDLTLERLIGAIQSPPVTKIGVFDVETFFPPNDRFDLAMAFNNILAAPGFASWLAGEPLDVSRMLHTDQGKPRHSIFYIAHLSDAERMFFVTLLLEQLLTWVRQQSGTTSLRALLYFDEVFGFFPPVANPPSKRPLLTLLKQARAFGVGVMLTTQNPVDLDYKGLTNTGTWFIGKLQTDRDKMRVLDGLEGITTDSPGSFSRSQLDRIISGLGSRVFLLHNVHEPQPVIFQTRWAMSYLRGPLTRKQVRQLSPGPKVSPPEPPQVMPSAPSPPARATVSTPKAARRAAQSTLPGYGSGPPAAGRHLSIAYLPVAVSRNRAMASLEEVGSLASTEPVLVYDPCVAAFGRVRFFDRKRKINEVKDVRLLIPIEGSGAVMRWEEAEGLAMTASALDRRPESEALFGTSLPSTTATELKAIKRDFRDYLYHEVTLEIFSCPPLKLFSQPDDTEGAFRVRVQQAAREKRDVEVEKLRRKMKRSIGSLERKLARERLELEEDRQTYTSRKREEMISAGETIVGLLGIFGRRRSTGLSTAARRRRMTATAKGNIVESEEEIARIEDQLEEIRLDLEDQAQTIADEWSGVVEAIQTFAVKPRRTDVQVDLVALAWAPYWLVTEDTGTWQTPHRAPAW